MFSSNVEDLKIDAIFRRIAQAEPQIPAQAPPISKQDGASENKPKMAPEDRAVEIVQKKREFQSDREKQVYDVIMHLRKTIVEMADAIYQMKLTDSQVAEIAEKILVTLSDYTSEVTIERVKQIGQDLLLKEARKQNLSKEN